MYILCMCIYVCKIGGTFYSNFKNFQVSHPVVVGLRKLPAKKVSVPPPVEVLVIFYTTDHCILF